MKIKFQTDLFLTCNCNKNFEQEFELDEQTLKEIKVGNNLSHDILNFFILDLLTNTPSLNSLSNANSNFIIISESFLQKFFENEKQDRESLKFLKNLNILDKQAIFIPLIIDGVWNLIVIENILSLINPEILIEECNYDNTEKPKFIYIMFEKHSKYNFTASKITLQLIENFLNYYAKLKYNLNTAIFEENILTINTFQICLSDISFIKKVEDTGLVISKIIIETLLEKENMIDFINSQNYHIMNLSSVGVSYRNLLRSRYIDALNQKTSSGIDNIRPRKTESHRPNMQALDSRKKIITKISEFFEKIAPKHVNKKINLFVIYLNLNQDDLKQDDIKQDDLELDDFSEIKCNLPTKNKVIMDVMGTEEYKEKIKVPVTSNNKNYVISRKTNTTMNVVPYSNKIFDIFLEEKTEVSENKLKDKVSEVSDVNLKDLKFNMSECYHSFGNNNVIDIEKNEDKILKFPKQTENKQMNEEKIEICRKGKIPQIEIDLSKNNKKNSEISQLNVNKITNTHNSLKQTSNTTKNENIYKPIKRDFNNQNSKNIINQAGSYNILNDEEFNLDSKTNPTYVKKNLRESRSLNVSVDKSFSNKDEAENSIVYTNRYESRQDLITPNKKLLTEKEEKSTKYDETTNSLNQNSYENSYEGIVIVSNKKKSPSEIKSDKINLLGKYENLNTQSQTNKRDLSEEYFINPNINKISIENLEKNKKYEEKNKNNEKNGNTTDNLVSNSYENTNEIFELVSNKNKIISSNEVKLGKKLLNNLSEKYVKPRISSNLKNSENEILHNCSLINNKNCDESFNQNNYSYNDNQNSLTRQMKKQFDSNRKLKIKEISFNIPEEKKVDSVNKDDSCTCQTCLII